MLTAAWWSALLLVAALAAGGQGGAAAASGAHSGRPAAADNGRATLRIALLHLAPRSGDLTGNFALIEGAVARAARLGADWCVTPELALSGYYFRPRIGLAWIGSGTLRAGRVRALATVARSNDVSLFVGMPTRDGRGSTLRNSVVVIDDDGGVLGAYHKHDVIPGAIEGWATPGTSTGVYDVDGARVGVLLCADLWPVRWSLQTAAAGAQIIVAPTAWAPDALSGPHGRWEKDSGVSGLPLLVCNTTGRTPWGDNRRGASVVDDHGRRLLTFRSSTSKVFLVDWDRAAGSFTFAGSFRPAAAP